MIKENNILLELEFSKKKSTFIELYQTSTEIIYSLFDFILDNPIENFWYECFNIFLGYTQLLAYLSDSSVSFI